MGDSANTDAISSKLREVNSLKKIQIRGYFESKKENISHKAEFNISKFRKYHRPL